MLRTGASFFHNSLQEPSILAQRQNRETSPDTGAMLAQLDELGPTVAGHTGLFHLMSIHFCDLVALSLWMSLIFACSPATCLERFCCHSLLFFHHIYWLPVCIGLANRDLFVHTWWTGELICQSPNILSPRIPSDTSHQGRSFVHCSC